MLSAVSGLAEIENRLDHTPVRPRFIIPRPTTQIDNSQGTTVGSLKACGPERNHYVIFISTCHHLRNSNRDLFSAGTPLFKTSFTGHCGSARHLRPQDFGRALLGNVLRKHRGRGEVVHVAPSNILLSSRRSFERPTVWRTSLLPTQTDHTTDLNITRTCAELAVGSILTR